MNVNVISETVAFDAFIEVVLTGPGGGTVMYSDAMTAPGTAADALAMALSDLGLPASTALSSIVITPLAPIESFEQVVMSNYYPDTDPAFVIGDPDNYQTWIAIGPEDVIVEVKQTTTTISPFSISATIGAAPTVPLPAALPLLLAGLGGFAMVRRRAA